MTIPVSLPILSTVQILAASPRSCPGHARRRDARCPRSPTTPRCRPRPARRRPLRLERHGVAHLDHLRRPHLRPQRLHGTGPGAGGATTATVFAGGEPAWTVGGGVWDRHDLLPPPHSPASSSLRPLEPRLADVSNMTVFLGLAAIITYELALSFRTRRPPRPRRPLHLLALDPHPRRLRPPHAPARPRRHPPPRRLAARLRLPLHRLRNHRLRRHRRRLHRSHPLLHRPPRPSPWSPPSPSPPAASAATSPAPSTSPSCSPSPPSFWIEVAAEYGGFEPDLGRPPHLLPVAPAPHRRRRPLRPRRPPNLPPPRRTRTRLTTTTARPAPKDARDDPRHQRPRPHRRRPRRRPPLPLERPRRTLRHHRRPPPRRPQHRHEPRRRRPGHRHHRRRTIRRHRRLGRP